MHWSTLAVSILYIIWYHSIGEEVYSFCVAMGFGVNVAQGVSVKLPAWSSPNGGIQYIGIWCCGNILHHRWCISEWTHGCTDQLTAPYWEKSCIVALLLWTSTMQMADAQKQSTMYYMWTCMFLVTHPRLACYCTVSRTVVLCCACWCIIGTWCSVHCWLLGHIGAWYCVVLVGVLLGHSGSGDSTDRGRWDFRACQATS